ncbi:hypothetical protein [Streptomyces sp. NPDC102437]|uniref:hypothetical protein n=1 Tax=Streptomyces sp. NPDC102437 TaxID=3366175 RepID=UPI00380B7E2D
MSVVPCGSGFGVGDAVAVGGAVDGEAVGEDTGVAGLSSSVAVVRGDVEAAGALPVACPCSRPSRWRR